MSLSPEELEQRANQILGEKPVGLQEDQPGIVSLEGHPASAARTAFQNWTNTNDTEIWEAMAQSRELTYAVMQEQIQAALNPLTEREKAAMRLRFGLVDGQFRTYTQIGQKLGVHRTTASRTLARGLDKLRYPSRFIGPLDF